MMIPHRRNSDKTFCGKKEKSGIFHFSVQNISYKPNIELFLAPLTFLT